MAWLALKRSGCLVLLAVQPVVSLTLSKPWSPLSEVQKNESLNVWLQDVQSQREWVNALPVLSAGSTDRVAVTILQPATAEKINLMAHIARLNMHRLGPKWALQIFYCQEEEKDALDRLLGRPDNVVWAPITIRGERIAVLGRVQFSWFLLSMDFWSKVPEPFEHVLIFGDDSIVLKGPGCIDKYLDYDYVGAPWHAELRNMPRYGGNGGFRLVRRSSSVAAVKSPYVTKYKAEGPGRQRVHEDGAFVSLIHEMNGTFPSRDLAASFAVETVFQKSPCAV